ncbi:MAG: general stress protein [Actinomycetota bacterium]|nr:general stress protein [Actinomycetota bacterium]
MEGREAPDRVPEYTVVGVINDGTQLNQAVKEIRALGVDRDDLTVILKREDLGEPEPFPEGTRYIVVPGDKRGLEVPIGFAIAFIVFGILFAITTPAIGIPTLMIFLSLAGILFVGSLTRVGVAPILTEMEAPSEEAGIWNDEFEMGKVLVFASTPERRLLRPIRESLQRGGATYYIVDRRLDPRAVHQATLQRVGEREVERVERSRS